MLQVTTTTATYIHNIQHTYMYVVSMYVVCTVYCTVQHVQISISISINYKLILILILHTTSNCTTHDTSYSNKLKLKVRKHRFCYKATGTGKLITSLHLHLTLISLPNHVSSSSWPCDTFFFVHEKLSDFSVHPLRQKVVYWHFKHGW